MKMEIRIKRIPLTTKKVKYAIELLRTFLLNTLPQYVLQKAGKRQTKNAFLNFYRSINILAFSASLVLVNDEIRI